MDEIQMVPMSLDVKPHDGHDTQAVGRKAASVKRPHAPKARPELLIPFWTHGLVIAGGLIQARPAASERASFTCTVRCICI